MNKTRVLCFLDNPLGRDTEIVLPIIYVLERQMGLEVKTRFVWDLLYMKLWKPDMVLLPNTKGHHMYVEAAFFAKKNEITVLALESEGNFKTDGSFYYWGYNKDKIIYQEWLTCWSQRTKDYLKPMVGEQEQNKLVVTGGTGFDRYVFENFKSKEIFLKQWRLSGYDKVIGYAGWAFGKLYGAHIDQSFLHFKKWKSRDEALKWVESQRVFVKKVLETIIIDNPDKLFILKKHPKENYESDAIEGPNEMNELLHYDNVVYIMNEESIADLINVSDLWLAFESTTAVESWMLNKTTILINSEPNFPRSSPYWASLIVDSAEKLQRHIDDFYKKGRVPEFHTEELKKARRHAISSSIGFADGKNHLRVMKYFSTCIPKAHLHKKVSLSFRHLRLYLLMHLGRFFYNKKLFLKLPKFKKTIYVFENRKMSGFEQRKSKCYGFLDQFYQKGLNTSNLRTIRGETSIPHSQELYMNK